MRQHIYDARTVGMNFWGCYTKVRLEKERLAVINTLNDCCMTLSGSTDDLKALCSSLDKGVDDESLAALLSAIGCQPLLDDLLFKGMIE